WNESRIAAQALLFHGVPGHLASITSNEESTWVNQNMNFSGAQGVWIGGFQLPDSPEPADGWQWVTGETWQFTAWAPGEPNNNGAGPEGHLSINRANGLWNDANGDEEQMYYLVEFDVPRPSAAIQCLSSIGGQIMIGGAELDLHWRTDVAFAGTALQF